jgi:LacI family transcriptional regulator
MKVEESVFQGIKEIARRAKVSIATVDRVLHNRTGVSEKTKKKILEIIQEINYQPNILASRLASKKIISIAVLIPLISKESTYWEAPLKGIERAKNEIEQYGVQLVYYFFDLNSHASFVNQATQILESEIKGLLVSPSFVEQTTLLVTACQKKKIPVVFIDSNIPTLQNISYIGPHLYQSGYVGAKLLTYSLNKKSQVLVVNISNEIDNYNYLQIEEGFRAYFQENNIQNPVKRIDIQKTDYDSVDMILSQIMTTSKHIDGIFVTNSRVSSVAAFIKNKDLNHIGLVGYDFLEENVAYLREGRIDFLICHKPEEQGYKGIMTLYTSLILGRTSEKTQYMPIDIITKENEGFYNL